MLIPLSRAIGNKTITGIIHIGAHWAQEHDDYIKHGISKIVYIEPCKKAFEKLCDRFHDQPNVTLINVACGSKISKEVMHTETANQGQSNSILKPKLHLKQYPGIKFNGYESVDVLPLDFMSTAGYNMLNIDVQGYELEVLKGAKESLKHVDVVYTEVNRDRVYEGCAMIGEIDEYLSGFGFTRILTKWQGTWGDAVYVKN